MNLSNLKTGRDESPSWVRIPPPPPASHGETRYLHKWFRNSGSHDFTIDDYFVPEERGFSFQESKPILTTASSEPAQVLLVRFPRDSIRADHGDRDQVQKEQRGHVDQAEIEDHNGQYPLAPD
jgi:hypothetical protein